MNFSSKVGRSFLLALTAILFGHTVFAQTAGQDGQWGTVITWPHVPIAAANLPDGRVLTWSASERLSFPGSVNNEKTYWGIWDPATGLVSDPPTLGGHDMFCSHVVMLENGKVFVNGGRNSGNTPFTSIFDYATDSWASLNNMNRGRWYPTSVALADGTVFTAIGSGGGDTGESYLPSTGQWQLETGLDFDPLILNYQSQFFGERNWWPLLQLAPDGRLFHAGPTPQMHWIDTAGLGTATPTGPTFTDWYTKHGALVYYDDGMLLSAGGWVDGETTASTDEALTIDISGGTPVVTVIAPMLNKRKFHNAVMLPNGEVLMVGGNTSGIKFNDTGSIMEPEIWNPATGVWREGAPMAEERNYHSIALLLPDATVMSAGGGLCNCSADHANGQIYSPPYLFNPDGTPAARPQIISAPAAIRPGDSFDVVADPGITHFSVVKMSSTTHAVNTDLRYLSLGFSANGGDYVVDAHTNTNVLTPGYWMLFAVNAQGTPSVAAVVQVRKPNAGDPPAVSSLNVTYNNLSDLSAFQLNGDVSGPGSVLRLTANSNDEAGSGFYETPVLIGAETSFSTDFEFRIHGTGNGADGLTFALQGNASTDLGNDDNGLGYEGIINSLAIEIDNNDDGSGDPNGNHIGVNTGGDVDASLATAIGPFDLEDGNSHKMWIDYVGSTEVLSVYLAQNTTDPKPGVPLLSVPSVDLLSLIGSQGYFGFTGGTGSTNNNHDIEAWSLSVTASSQALVIDPVESLPQLQTGDVNMCGTATGTGLEYRWSFGDGSPQTGWSSSSCASHSYPAPGRYNVTLTVKDSLGNEQSVQFVQAVHPTLTAGKPQSSNSLFYDSVSSTGRVWNINPDNDTVTVIDAVTNTKEAEIAVGDEPRTLAMAPDNRVWVVNKQSSSISVIDSTSLNVVDTYQLAVGAEPHGIVFDSTGGFAFVSLEALGQVLKLNATDGTELASLDVGPDPRHLSLTGDKNTLYVTRFITPPLTGESTTSVSLTEGGEVLAVNPVGTMSLGATTLLGYSPAQAQEQTGPGFPNYLGPAIISPGGVDAWVPSKQDNIPRGSARNGNHLTFEHTVRAVTSTFNLSSGLEDLGKRVDQDNASVASNGAFGIYGVYLFIALEGNRQISIIDAYANSSEELSRVSVGFAPQAITVSDDGNTLYVHNFLSRTISVVDVSALMNGQSVSGTVTTNIGTVATEKLAGDVLLGKQFFYDAADFRLATQSYMACASCHNDGDGDGRVWDFTGFGEGLRNTIALKGHAGTGQGRLHWSANFDEVHDFENQIRDFTLGAGLMSNPDFTATEPTLGPPKAGLSSDLDALAAYVSSLNSFGSSPHRDTGGALTAAGANGRILFELAGCASCHSGTGFTDSSKDSVLLHDIGTIQPASGQRMFGPLNGIDTPTLKGLWRTGPYLHNGSAATIRAAIEAHDPSVITIALSGPDLDDIAEFLLQADDAELGFQSLYQEDSGGLLVMEAENFSDNLPGTATAEWIVLAEGGASNGSKIASPAGGFITNPPDSAYTEYQANIVVAGNHYVWVRFKAFTSGSDSVFGEFDSLGHQKLTLRPVTSNWEWQRFSGAFFLDAGVHAFKLLRREQAAEFDKIVVTTDPGYPAPVGLGPPESARSGGGGPTNQPPLLTGIGNQTVTEDDSLTIDLDATDPEGDNMVLSQTGMPSFATFTDNGDGTGQIVVTPLAGDAGTYPMEVLVDDDGLPSAGTSEAFSITVIQAGATTFQEDVSGLLVMEAENVSGNVAGAATAEWSILADAGASSGGKIASPAGPFITNPPDSAYTEYQANIVVPGNHYIWVRFKAFTSGSDSVFGEVDSLGHQKLTLRPVTSNWEWQRFSGPFSLGAGVHTFKLLRREQAAEFDKIVVTTDPNYPAPTGEGPPQSPLQ